MHAHTHRHTTQIKLWKWDSVHWLSPQSREPPTAKQSGEKNDEIDRWNWRKTKMFMVFSQSGLYLWLQIWFISLISLPFLHFLCLRVSKPRHLASPVSNWLLGLLSFCLMLFFSYYSRFSAFFIFHISCSLCWGLFNRPRCWDKELKVQYVHFCLPNPTKEEFKIFMETSEFVLTLNTESDLFK